MDLTYFYNGYYPYITFIGKPKLTDFFEIIEGMLLRKKPFIFLLDCRKVKNFSVLNEGIMILNWLKKNKIELRKYLKGSTIVMESKIITDILNWVFKIQPPVTPNLITRDIEEGKLFLEDYIPKELKSN